MPDSQPSVRIITLGCAKNEVDSEEIAGVLEAQGYRTDASNEGEVTIINTCGFLESAKQESIQAIKQAVAAKGSGKVIVAGCLAQRLGEELVRLAPGADSYVGVGRMAEFHTIVRSTFENSATKIDLAPPHHKWAEIGTRTRSVKPWSAYLKVSEGCDHRCTFCTIPSFRGNHQSKPIERVLKEAEILAKSGAIELNLIAQDVTQYGFDLYQKFMLPELLRGLNSIEGIRWIRLLYYYPNKLTDEVIEAIASLDRVLPYVDMPLQHVNDDVLRRMKRPWNGDRYLALFEKLRARIPQVAIRTTFIVGFPGETESEFQSLIDFVKLAKLDRVGAFTFSREPGTIAHDLPGQVPFRTKRERYDKLMRIQSSISMEINKSWVGKSIDVLVEDFRDGWIVGRSYRDAPEIDGCVFAPGTVEPGTIVPVKITEAEVYDLYGEIVGARSSSQTQKPQSKPVEPL